jgi:hypothetical protein
LRGDSENWNTAAVTIVKSIDQMQISRAATSGTNRETSGEMRFRAGGERSRFFVPHVNPFHALLFTNRIGDAVEGVATNAVDSFHSGLQKGLDD